MFRYERSARTQAHSIPDGQLSACPLQRDLRRSTASIVQEQAQTCGFGQSLRRARAIAKDLRRPVAVKVQWSSHAIGEFAAIQNAR
jgi:hypothetical protein